MFYLSTWARISSSLITNYDYCHKNTSLYREKNQDYQFPQHGKVGPVALLLPRASLHKVWLPASTNYAMFGWNEEGKKERRGENGGREGKGRISIPYGPAILFPPKLRENGGKRREKIVSWYFIFCANRSPYSLTQANTSGN